MTQRQSYPYVKLSQVRLQAKDAVIQDAQQLKMLQNDNRQSTIMHNEVNLNGAWEFTI